MPCCCNSVSSQASKRFLWAAPALNAGCAGVFASSAIVRRKPQPRHRGVSTDFPSLVKRLRTLSATVPSVSANQRILEIERRLVPGRNGFGDELVLAGEVIVERFLGDAGLLGDGVHAHRPDALAIEQARRRNDDLLACAVTVSGHG